MSLFVYIKDHLPILDVVAEFVPIKPAGNYWKGSCPFHSEKDASFTVSPEKQIFYCFGCHASGDVISFIAKIENINQKQAAEYLVERYKISIPQHLLQSLSSPQSQQEKDTKNHYFALCKALATWTNKYLLSQPSTLKYVLDRGIDNASLKNFVLGYFPSGQANMSHILKDLGSQGFLLKEFIEYGIMMEGRGGLYSPFEERILFPIKDAMGRYCGFGGRIFRPGDERPKYYNSKENDGFEKGKLLFGLDNAKKSLQEKSIGFLVEGYIDCIMMVQHGYTNTVATLGTACTLEHLKALSRYVHTLFVLYDGDQAGQKAMLRLTELCWEVNLELKVVRLPQGHDPASFLVSGQDIAPLTQNAIDIITFFIDSTGAGFSAKPLAHKLAALEKILVLMNKIQSNIKQDILLNHTAQLTNLPVSSLKNQLLLLKSSRRDYFLPEKPTDISNTPEQEDLTTVSENSLLEEKIFSAIMYSLKAPPLRLVPQILQVYLTPVAQHVFEVFDIFIKQNGDTAPQSRFLDMLEDDKRTWAIHASMCHDGQQCLLMIEHLFTRFYKYHWQQIVQDFKAQIIQAKLENDAVKVQGLLERFAQIKQGIVHSRGLI